MSVSTTLKTFASLQNDTSATTDLNNNFNAINLTLANALALNGQSPNQMQSALDMNSNQILNLPAPLTTSSPLRVVDASTLGGGGTIIVSPLPLGGTTGQVLTKHSNANFDVTWGNAASYTGVTIVPTAGTISSGLVITQQPGGTFAGNVNYNLIQITNDIAALAGFGIGLNVSLTFGGSVTAGGRAALQGFTDLSSATVSTNSNRNYIGVQGTSWASSGDGGTDTNAGALGNVFGGSFWSRVLGGATNLYSAVGCEVDIGVDATATVKHKIGLLVDGHSLDAVQGVTTDALIVLSCQANNIKFQTGIQFGNATNQFPPVSTTGTLIQAVGSTTVLGGIDFSAYTFTGHAFNSTGFFVDGLGNIQGLTLTTSNGLSTPSVVGGATASSTLNLESTSGVGTTDKIQFFTGSQVQRGSISSNGNWAIGAQPATIPFDINPYANAASVSTPYGGSGFRMTSNDSGVGTVISIDGFMAAPGALVSRVAQGPASARTGVLVNYNLLQLMAEGWTSAGAYSGVCASMSIVATETYTNAANGSSFNFQTTPNGTTVRADALNIRNSGGLSIGVSAADPGIGGLNANGSITACGNVAVPAGGTASKGVMVSSTANLGVFFGSGVPTLSAAQGSLYIRTDGSSTTTRMYINTNGSTTWTAVTTVA